MKKPTIVNFLTILFLVILVSGCGINHKAPLKQPWVDRWLNRPICKPPCWEGITPGETTAKEAHEKLAALPDVEKFWLPSERTSPHVLSWDMAGCDGAEGGRIYFDTYPNGKIEWMQLFMGCDQQDASLKEVIDAFGVPDYSWAEWNSAGCKAELLNLKKGMILTTYESGFISYKKLKPTSPVEAVLLFPTGDSLEKVVEALPYLADTDIREWQVYDNPCTW